MGERAAGKGRSGRRTRRRASATTVILLAAILANCSSDGGDSASDEPAAETPSTESVSPDDGSQPSDDGSADAPDDTQDASADSVAADCPDQGEPTDLDGFDSVELEDIGGGDGVSVSAAVFPLPDTEGNPWSQWGQGVVLPDGRFVSAVGDHLGQDGTSYFYEYDPSTGRLTRTTEVSEGLDHQAGDWGYGKVHAPMLLSPCGEVIAATYWGTRRHLELGDSYQGDHLFTYDTSSREIQSLGVPVVGFGLPSIALSPDGKWIFGEAVDSASDTETDTGIFFVADAETGEVVHEDDNPDHVGFRSIMVTPDGEGLYSVGGGDLVAVDPVSGDTRLLEDVLPGDWLRASTQIGPDGTVYGATREPDALFSVAPDGTFTDMGELEDYVASLALSPDGRTLYYVPGAHGSGWEYGTPLMSVDVETGEHKEVVRLNDLIEPAFDLRAGGTYDVVVDPSGDRIYIGLNAGPIDDEEDAFGQVVLAVVELDR